MLFLSHLLSDLAVNLIMIAEAATTSRVSWYYTWVLLCIPGLPTLEPILLVLFFILARIINCEIDNHTRCCWAWVPSYFTNAFWIHVLLIVLHCGPYFSAILKPLLYCTVLGQSSHCRYRCLFIILLFFFENFNESKFVRSWLVSTIEWFLSSGLLFFRRQICLILLA